MSHAIPNLFILGAPKCGTTALTHWLALHPEVYAPPAKEPHYFSTEYCLTPARSEYARLYRDWSVDERWAFDASVWSLFSPTAVPNIIQEQPDAHFIVMLRNPLQMIPSMHRQQIFNGNELEPDLRSALALNACRAIGEEASVLAGYPPDHLAYYTSCALGWQVDRLKSLVKSEHLHFITYDDLARAPAAVLTGVFHFLDLEPQLPTSFKKINAAKVRRFPLLDRASKSIGDWKNKQGITWRLGVLSWLRSINRKSQPIPPLTEDIVTDIQEKLAEDVRLLSSCIGRDVTFWFDAPTN
ncbi:sulfotransferase family protein [Spiribacter vilamensis]|uniref:Sulfotransferase domain-containing protein n=1 Tax=Spiribacter vilamensis TaxID=531306 RepID=A0A4Q8D1H1_9GAMM|nr:sulfotransferase domain-containing protein [Spiribacter vilamensis]RZU99100.1 sulfotransferase domain-containing protein [Spiribacter vilamensis]TVO61903.1 sulfotransferase [Spiribacter vilamensis]